MADRFGVHRSTVREAIRQVEQEGLVQRREGRRLFVTLPGLYDLAPRAARLLLLQQTTFRELWQVAVTLEPLAARLAAEHAEPADLDELAHNTELTAALQAHDADSVEHNTRLVELDVEFHALVGRASHNRALMLAREPISLLYNPTLLQIHLHLPQSKARNLAAHRAILDALQRRDAERGRMDAQAHGRFSKRFRDDGPGHAHAHRESTVVHPKRRRQETWNRSIRSDRHGSAHGAAAWRVPPSPWAWAPSHLGAHAQDTFKVGVVSFLSGQAAESFGIPAVTGAKALVEAFNKGEAPAPYNKTGFGGMKIEAIYVDENGGATKRCRNFATSTIARRSMP